MMKDDAVACIRSFECVSEAVRSFALDVVEHLPAEVFGTNPALGLYVCPDGPDIELRVEWPTKATCSLVIEDDVDGLPPRISVYTHRLHPALALQMLALSGTAVVYLTPSNDIAPRGTGAVTRRMRDELEAMVAEGICRRVIEKGAVRYELVIAEERD